MPTLPPPDSTGGSPQPPGPAAPQIIVQQQASALGRYGKFAVLLLGMSVMTIVGLTSSYQSYFSPPGGPQEKYHSLSKTAEEKIAVVQIAGTIMEGDGFVKQQLDLVRKDEQVVAVVLRINSPGGTVTGSDYLYHHVRELAKDRELPVVVSMGSICASGGYYIAMAVGDQQDAIFAEPTTWTGSIGVVIPHYDFSGLLKNYDIKDDSIASHKYKLMGSPTRNLSADERVEERQLFQDLVDLSFEGFKEIVRSGRPQLRADDQALDAVATGQIFTAQQAHDLGLVDEIGFVEAAIERAAELAGRKSDQLRCVKYTEAMPSLATLLSGESSSSTLLGADLRSFLDMTAPRAYYLCTWLPSVLSNAK
jgi:protease-4